MRTFGSVLDETRGIGKGFDFLRIVLSFGIVAWHSIVICYGSQTETMIWETPVGTLAAALLPMFFALSGFLVMGSAVRVNSLSTFVGFRALRILPALSTEVVLAAVVVGAAATTLPLPTYFLSPGFYRYLQNIIGHISFFLPGVFQANPVDTVNASLWTIPPEIFCYLFIALMILSKAYRNRTFYLLVAALLLALNMLADQAFVGKPSPQGPDLVRQYFLCFVVGNIFFLWRHIIPRHWLLFIIAAAVSFFTLRLPGFYNVALITLTYCVLFAGTAALPRLPLLSRGDYSYGVYLYGYPVQQVIAALFPAWRLWWFNILASLPVILAIAALSWHLVEKPTLSLKVHLKPLSRLEVGWLDSYLVRLALTLLLTCYGVVLLHWSNLDASASFSFRTHWFEVLPLSLMVALLAAGRPRPRPALTYESGPVLQTQPGSGNRGAESG